MNEMKNAPLVPITDVLSFIVDNRGKTVPTAESGFPLIATNCVHNERLYPVFENIRYVSEYTLHNWFRAELKANDILFVNKGTPGRCCLVPDPVSFCAAQDMIGLRCDEQKVYYRYLLMVLRSTTTQKFISNYHVGIAIPHFKKEDLSKLLIPLPSMEYQKRIGDLYFDICEKEEHNNSICADLEAMAKLLYDYWFVQFDFPDENGKPYKSSGGKMVWNEELKREIPEGWEAKRIRDIAIEGKDKPYNGDSIETIDLSVMPSGNMMLSSINSSENFSTNLFEMKQGDILFGSIRPYLKKAGIAPCNGAVAGTLHSFRPKRPSDYNFLAITLCNERVFDYATNASQGTKMPVVTLDTLMNYPIAYNSEISAKYNRINIKDIFAHCVMENLSLSTLRELLLPMLMNGQVKVGGKE